MSLSQGHIAPSGEWGLDFKLIRLQSLSISHRAIVPPQGHKIIVGSLTHTHTYTHTHACTHRVETPAIPCYSVVVLTGPKYLLYRNVLLCGLVT